MDNGYAGYILQNVNVAVSMEKKICLKLESRWKKTIAKDIQAAEVFMLNKQKKRKNLRSQGGSVRSPKNKLKQF